MELLDQVKQALEQLKKARIERLQKLEYEDPIVQNINGQIIAYTNIVEQVQANEELNEAK